MREKREMIKRRGEAGQTLTLVGVSLVVFLLVAGLAVDMGYLRYQKRLMQAAADSAALAAATDQNHGNGASAEADALAIAVADGFQNNASTTVTVGPNGLNPGSAMEVDIQEVFPTFFMPVAGFPSSTISASAVATVGTSNGCMYALGLNDPTGLRLTAGVDAPNCGIVTNGALNGNGSINSPSVGVYGTNAYGGVSSSAVEAIPQPANDPLAYLNPPAAGGCIPDPMLDGTKGPLGNGVITLPFGDYCSITINSGAIVTFSSGLYILNGPGGTGLQVNGTGIAMSDVGGVTFYVDTGRVYFNGTGNVTLTASEAGAGGLPPGILFYQDQNDHSAADMSEGGLTGKVKLSGTLYFPRAALTIAGSVGGTNAVTVAQNITVNGTTVLEADSTSIPGGSPLQNVSLVE